MTDKELKKFKRAELLEIILALQENQDRLQAENERLQRELEYRHKLLAQDEVLGGPAGKLNAAIKELKCAADAYLLSLEKEGSKIIAKRNTNHG